MTKNEFIVFHKPFTDSNEINEVTETIASGWLTSGPKVLKFENEFNNYIGSKYSVTANSWTAAAHLSLEAIGIKAGDEVIIPSITFTATAEIVCYFGAVPVVVDVQPDTLNIDPIKLEQAITDRTKAIIPVHYGGQPCDMDEILEIARRHNLKIIEDAAHSFPAYYKNRMVGTIGDVTCFSFYVTKTLATGEGGMICTEDKNIAERCSIMRLHGISKDAWKRYTAEGSWFYEVIAPGYKYNFTDIQASLGLAQLKKVDRLLKMRMEIVNKYNEGFKNLELIEIPVVKHDRKSAWHLYPIRLNLSALKINRSFFIEELKKSGVGASVHFIPLYHHPYYRDLLKPDIKSYPVSETEFPRLISLPLWPGMSNVQVDRVIDLVNSIAKKNKL